MEQTDHGANIWWRVLLALNAFFILFGVATAWLGALPPSSLWAVWITEHFFGGSMPEDARTMYDFMRGPLGGTMAGSYLLQTMIVAIPLRRGERWAWWTILAATALWFVLDSVVSIAHGAWFNVWRINLTALASMTIVLVAFARSAKLSLWGSRPREPLAGP